MSHDPSMSALVDRYLLTTADIRHLEEERERLRDAILAAADPDAREIAGTGGAVRLAVQRSCRFEAARVVHALDEARLLAGVASVTGPRLRRALEDDPAVERAVSGLYQPVETRMVTAVPARLRWTPAAAFVERLRGVVAHD